MNLLNTTDEYLRDLGEVAMIASGHSRMRVDVAGRRRSAAFRAAALDCQTPRRSRHRRSDRVELLEPVDPPTDRSPMSTSAQQRSPNPQGPPARGPARKRRWLLPTLGALLGILVHLVIFALSSLRSEPTDTADYRSLNYLVGGVIIAAPLSLLAGINLAVFPRTRLFGLGLLIGTCLGVIGGLTLTPVLIESPIGT